MPTIDIDGDAAHDAAQRELQKPIYPKPSLTEQLIEWLNDLIYRLASAGSKFPGGWFTLSVLLILVVIAIVVAIRIARRTMRTNRGTSYALFGEHELSAAEHRSAAEQAAAEGNWAAAIRHRLRAVARHLEDTGVLDAIPGRTATELARDGGKALPPFTAELARAADAFNDVTYGDRPGTESAYRMIADLDDHLRSRTTSSDEAAAATATPAGWAEVR
ncbi:hypothetical protein MycrhN_2117 [Mycolicibacterium rhodesiae NBB3]|uniref:Protein-glutamine gamma-glutamyltransferase-like C-terminal domain-containing protein n=1 Tax=Mycolicibacterium rhodesiae (strain NBB3) TaxID=710685 RepID=G8RQW3_MYCRN|nr:DUF4129 domain-containing protein [Mycolicibacterium rhodesiae]AEV72714.1 hypothetical protein MycrhN_2117 [Mycolicibacterium rhodesiae NBB3]